MEIKVYGDEMTVEDIFADSSNMRDFAERLKIAGRASDLSAAILKLLSDQNIQSSRYSSQRFAFEEAAPIAAYKHAQKQRQKDFPDTDFSHLDMSDEGIIRSLKKLGKPTEPPVTN